MGDRGVLYPHVDPFRPSNRSGRITECRPSCHVAIQTRGAEGPLRTPRPRPFKLTVAWRTTRRSAEARLPKPICVGDGLPRSILRPLDSHVHISPRFKKPLIRLPFQGLFMGNQGGQVWLYQWKPAERRVRHSRLAFMSFSGACWVENHLFATESFSFVCSVDLGFISTC